MPKKNDIAEEILKLRRSIFGFGIHNAPPGENRKNIARVLRKGAERVKERTEYLRLRERSGDRWGKDPEIIAAAEKLRRAHEKKHAWPIDAEIVPPRRGSKVNQHRELRTKGDVYRELMRRLKAQGLTHRQASDRLRVMEAEHVERLTQHMLKRGLSPEEAARHAKQQPMLWMDMQFTPRGTDGRISTGTRKTARQQRALELREQRLTQKQIAEKLELTERQVRRYLTGL